MKVCLNSNLGQEYLKKADEIRVRDFNNVDIIPDLIEKYPDATIVLNEPFSRWITEEDLQKLKTTNILCKNKFILCLRDLTYVDFYKENDIKFYYGYPVSSFFQLDALADLGVCYVRLDAPLFFDLDKVKKYGVPVRAVPNVSYIDGIRRINGVLGT